MEDDDEFGDLYSDVLPPFTTSVQPQHAETAASNYSQSRPIDRGVDSDDGENLRGALELKSSILNSNSSLAVEPNASIKEKTLIGRFDLNLDASNILGDEDKGLEKGDGARLPEKGLLVDDDDLNIVVEESEQKDDDFVEKDVIFLENVYSSAEPNENVVDHVGVAAGMEAEQTIPGLSGNLENHDGWESDDSEDDLRIVLNDNNVHTGMAAGDDGDGEALVILADDSEKRHHHQQTEMGEQELGADAERKVLGNTATTSAAVQPKIGYSNHMYHNPQFKYVRPGADSITGAASMSFGGNPGQARPPIHMGAVAGRGRGDWQPAAVGAIPMQKGLQHGYGMPVRGANAVGRGFGSRMDFTLPSHKTIFEVHIDGFEEKSWRVPGIDSSDFFNFGLNEGSWKEYCKNLEQLRLGASMQSKIRVYESGRGEQDYDPDLPPELAAAVGIQGIPSENANYGNADAAATDLARGSERPPAPVGRPIPVEIGGSSDRLPSIDTRRPRMHDSDAVIEIICQSSVDDDDRAEQQNNAPSEEDEVHELQQDGVDCNHHISHAYNGQKGELVSKREQLKNTINGDDIGMEDNLHVVSEAPVKKYQPDNRIGFPYEKSDHRSAKGRGHVKIPKMTASANSGEKQDVNVRDESFDYRNGKRNPHLSSSLVIVSDEEQAAAVADDNDASVLDDRSFDAERENMTPGATIADACEDGNLRTTKQNRISDVEQVSQENDDREYSKASRSSENSKARSGSSKDQRSFHDTFDDEVPQDRHQPQTGNSKRPLGDEDDAHRRSRDGREEIRKHNMAVKEREDLRSRRGGDPNSSLNRHMKSESTEWRKVGDPSERSWRRRDDEPHGRKIRVDDIRKSEHGGEIGSRSRGKARESQSGKRDQNHPSRYQLDSANLRGANRDHSTGSRQRDWYDNKKEGTRINMEHAKKEEVNYYQREDSSHRKRERDDSSDQQKVDKNVKIKDDDIHNVRRKQEGLLQKERGERQRVHDEWNRHKQLHEESLPRREREEKRSVMRSGRPVEDKTWDNHSRRSNDYGKSRREYHSKDVGRHGEQPKRMDRIENGSFPQDTLHEDSYARGNLGSNDVTRARYKRVDRNDIHVVHASNTSRLYERRQSKESESGDHSSLISYKKNKDDHIGQISEKVNMRGITEQGNVEDDTHVNQQSSGKHADEASSDDNHCGSRREHSKSEHGMIHKEMLSATKISEEPPEKMEENQQPSVDNKDSGNKMNNAKAKVDDKHLDSVEKLHMRSERFKLPMPSEKETMAFKSETSPSVQTDNRSNSEIKSERPPRKRRWTGN